MSHDILRVIEYYNLITSSSITDKFKITCPFHGDDDASCYIDLHRNTYYCFGCGSTGDALKFIENIENTNSLKAIMLYTKMGGNKSDKSVKVILSKPVNIQEALDEAKIYFYSISKPSWQYIKKNYMNKRGFTSDVLKAHDIKIGSDQAYQIICPIKDLGRFRGYVKRRTDGQDNEKKYLYNKGFRRKLVVMGDYDLGGWIPITEGYMDWLKLKQNGLDNATAIFGWKIMEKQIQKLQQYTDRVVSALDNTPTGEAGTRLLEEYFHVVRFQFPDDCKDAGDLSEIHFKKAWSDTLKKIKEYEKEM